MRHLWGSDQKLDWDDPIPEKNGENWITFFKDLPNTIHEMYETLRCN